MTDRSSLFSSACVGIAIVGSAIGDQLVSLAGPLLALAISVWTEYRTKRADQRSNEERRHLRDKAEFYLRRAARAEAELARLRSEPAAVTPPFPPGEAAADA